MAGGRGRGAGKCALSSFPSGVIVIAAGVSGILIVCGWDYTIRTARADSLTCLPGK